MKKHYKNPILIKKVCEKLNEIRELNGVTQETLVELTDFDLRQIGRILRGETNPTISSIEAIATVLNIQLKDVFDFVLKPTEKFNLTKFKLQKEVSTTTKTSISEKKNTPKRFDTE